MMKACERQRNKNDMSITNIIYKVKIKQKA